MNKRMKFSLMVLSLSVALGAPLARAVDAPTPAPAADPDAKAQAISAYNSGLEAVRKGDWENAAGNFEKAVGLDSKDTSSFMFLGYVRLKQEKFDAALAALQSAEKLMPAGDTQGKATLYNNLGLVYWSKNQPADAITAYQKALQFDKKAGDAQYNLAFALLSQKRYADAAPQLEALSKTSTDPAMQGTIYDALGEAYENQKDLGKALGAYKKAIELRPKEPSYPLHMALALINSNRKNDAVAYLIKVTELDPQSTDPQNAEAFLQLGAIHIERRKWNDAQDVLKRYVALRPADALGWFNLGVAYDYTGTAFNEALDAYGKAQKLDAKNAAIHNNVGRIHFKRGKNEEAIAALQKALDLDGQSSDARHNLAIVYADQARSLEKDKKLDEAKAKYAAADTEWRTLLKNIEDNWRKEADPERKSALASLKVGAHAGLAEIALTQKNYTNAIFEYERLLDAAPDNVVAKINLGLAFYHNKQWVKAEAVYRDITAKDKTNAVAFNNLGAVLEAQGNKPGALDAYREAVRLKADYVEAINNLKRLQQATKVG